MSLVDAFLLEPYRDPRQVYIALRSDGQKGSGTMDDPYDGGTRLGPALTATLSCNRYEFVVGTGQAHGLNVGDMVTITNCVGPGAPWFNVTNAPVQAVLSPLHFTLLLDSSKTGTPPTTPPPAAPDVPYYFNGYIYANYTAGPNNKNILPTIAHIYWPIAKVTVPANHGLGVFDGVTIGGVTPNDYAGDYPILGPTSSTGTTFACRLKFLPTAADGSARACTVARRIHRFDDVMRSVPTYSVIHLGPGTFQTRGSAPIYISHPTDYRQVYVGWVMQYGQRLLGSGIDVSVVQLVLPMDEINQTGAITHHAYPVADYSEVADLTVDCNAAGHTAPYGTFPAPVTCGGVTLGGSFIRIRRVRAINFCVQATAECFPIGIGPGGIGSPPPIFNVIEDCILEKPGENNTHETSLVVNAGDGIAADARSPVARHIYSNCEYLNGPGHPVKVASLTRDSGDLTLATLTTIEPHQHIPGKALVVRDALVGGSPNNPFNGVFPVEPQFVVSATVLKYRMRADPLVASADVTNATIGHPLSSELVALGTGAVHPPLDAITYPPSPDDGTALVTTKRPHNRTAKNNVVLGGVFKKVPIVGGGTAIVPSSFSGSFPITEVVSDTQFKIRRPADAPDKTDLVFYKDSNYAALGVDFHSPTALAGTGCVTEGNASFDCLNGFYADTGSTRDAVVRNNYHSNVGLGVLFNFGQDSGRDGYQSGASITFIPGSSPPKARFTALKPHGKIVGDSVTIRDSGAAGPDPSNPYHGTVTISAKTTYTFDYALLNLLWAEYSNCPGRPVFGSSLTATLDYNANNNGRVLATANAAHGFSEGDFVTVYGVTATGYSGFVRVRLDTPGLLSTQFEYDPIPVPTQTQATGAKLDLQVGAPLVRNGSLATMTTVSNHRLIPNQLINLKNAYINGSLDNPFNGYVLVNPLSARTFSYAVITGGPDPDPSKSATGAAEFAALWQNRLFVMEQNLYDLYPPDATSALLTIGASMYGLAAVPPYRFPQVVVNENVFRYRDNAPPLAVADGAKPRALLIHSAENVLVQRNIVAVSSELPLVHQLSTHLNYDLNSTPSGTPITGARIQDGVIPDPPELVPSIDQAVADALLMALL